MGDIAYCGVKKNWIIFFAGLLTYGAHALIVVFPNYWLVWSGGLIVVLAFLVSMRVKGHYKSSGPVLGILSIVVPAIGVMFLIPNVFLQHLYGVGVALIVIYYFIFIGFGKKGYGHTLASGTVFVLANIFFSSSLSLGLFVFFDVSFAFAFALFVALLIMYPRRFEVYSKVECCGLEAVGLSTSRDMRKTGEYDNRLLATSSWMRGSFLLGSVQHMGEDGKLRVRIVEYTKREKLASWILLGLFVELFVMLSMFPVNVFTVASALSIIAFCAISLAQLGQLNLFRTSFVVRYSGICAIFVLLIFFSAKWS